MHTKKTIRKTKKLQVTLSLEIINRLEQVSAKLGCTKTSLFALLVAQGLNQMEIGQRAFEQMTNNIADKVKQELSKEIKELK